MKKSLFVKKQGNVDFTFLTTLIILIIFGLTMTFSASSASAHYQYNDAFYFKTSDVFCRFRTYHNVCRVAYRP